jgi:hypothetical protein
MTDMTTGSDVTPNGLPFKGDACATGSNAISALVGLSTGNDAMRPRRASPGKNMPTRMRNRKLRNIRASGAFWPEMT